MRIKPRAIATVLCMIFFVGFAVCGVVRSTDKETLEIKQSYPVLAEAEPMIMADLLMESPNLTPEVEKEPDYPLTQEEIDLIALVTMGEAEGETELGKRLVIDTILNRIDHTSFPDTVYDVVYQPNQFSVMWNSWNGQITIVCSSWPEDTASMVSLCYRSVVTTFRVMTERRT